MCNKQKNDQIAILSKLAQSNSIDVDRMNLLPLSLAPPWFYNSPKVNLDK